jgi:hypothetical protein
LIIVFIGIIRQPQCLEYRQPGWPMVSLRGRINGDNPVLFRGLL